MTYEQKIQEIVSNLDDVVTIATGKAAAVFLGEFSDRIFNKGKAADDSNIGTYDKDYAEYRKEYGLQTAYVDLTFTTELFRNIVQDKNTVIFKNEYGQEISKHNEDNFNKKIFAPSVDERKIAIEIMQQEINKLFE